MTDKFNTKLGDVKKEIISSQKVLETFDFGGFDDALLERLIDISNKIVFYNDCLYTVKNRIEDLQRHLSEKIVLDLDRIETIFKESNLYFGEQIKKDYQDLINYNKCMANDRNKLFEKQLAENQQEIIEINAKLEKLNAERKKLLDVIFEEGVFEKFEHISKRIGDLRYEQGKLEACLEQGKECD